MKSLDPRVNRMKIVEGEAVKTDGDNKWESFEVFHQKKTGTAYVHVGSLQASDHEMAIVLAKEQYGWRQTTTGLWVVKSANVFALDDDETNMFATTPEKKHREAVVYKTRDKITEFKNRNKA